MSISVAINHKTQYHYDRPVSLSPHIFRLRPAVHCRTPIEAYSLKIEPKTHFINWQQDPFGNYQARVIFPEPAWKLEITVDVIARMVIINPFDFFVDDYAREFPFVYEPSLDRELTSYLELDENNDLLKTWLRNLSTEKRQTIDFLVELNQKLSRDIKYIIRMEPGVQACHETLQLAQGSCRDSAWLLVQIMRHLGLAARFVSGYLIQLVADQPALDGPSGTDHDFTDLHAWAEVYIPGAGWIGLDPTSGLFAGEGHIPLACTPHPSQAAPVTGATDPCQSEFSFSNSIKRLRENPRVTRPYTDFQWAEIDALGRQVDDDLTGLDVRLTMGGEPTFISLDDMDGPEWNFTADSPRKKALANDLIRRLRNAFAPGSLLYYGLGKWYPGEPLPRWRMACYWRQDGIPLWSQDHLLADFNEDYGYGNTEARLFLTTLCEALSLPVINILPAHEDTFYYLWMEGNLPVNIDPLKLSDQEPLEHQYLRHLLEQGLDEPVGYVLPLKPCHPGTGWRSSLWSFRRHHLFLIPGGSPLGLRLPLDSIQWIPPEQREPFCEQSMMQDLPALATEFPASMMAVTTHSTVVESRPNESDLSNVVNNDSTDISTPGIDVVRTAISCQARDGRIYLFLPPVERLEHYLELLSVIERTAIKTGLPIVIEGYAPPLDYRLNKVQVTPDPGVIEVNIHPSTSWDELVHNTTTLYEQARLARLGCEKFMVDGRHTGTGGGNHIIVGGPTPADSPFLRRPDLLRSLITFWQHHPSLSYLFSSIFIGPTSQAPRIDEARDDSLYELEIAFSQMPANANVSPWLVDRLLRNLLVDSTGNTHRAEFCIDKLYSPDSESGRLGLVELRAFEMTPHPRMSLVQAVLVRALIAHFWRQPYRKKLIRWGTELHDRFMLPHYVWNDIREIVEFLNQAGYPVKLDWFEVFLEFRFPTYGAVNIRDMTIDLRAGIEPWHVLGEEVTSSGTARFVDSSIERLQIKVCGLTDKRHVVTCNRCRLPMHATGVHGEYVTGVRYRAWNPPNALHPTIGIHSPLVFDIVDTWNGRSLGGCVYHVAHHGGRHYETRPVNAYEAEGRRIARFWDHGHSAGTIDIPPVAPPFGYVQKKDGGGDIVFVTPELLEAEFPYTLDLRRISSSP